MPSTPAYGSEREDLPALPRALAELMEEHELFPSGTYVTPSTHQPVLFEVRLAYKFQSRPSAPGHQFAQGAAQAADMGIGHF